MHDVITTEKLAEKLDDEVDALHPLFCRPSVMTDSPPPDAEENRSFACFPTLHTERIVVDVSNLPVGHLEGPFQQDSSNTSKSPSDSRSHDGKLLLGSSTASQHSWDEEITCSTYAARRHDNFEESTNIFISLPPEEDDMTMSGVVNMTERTEPAAELPQPLQQPQPYKKQKRSKFTFSRQRFVATSSFYLHPDTSSPPPEVTPNLVGQIIRCPSKKNDFNFEVQWCHQQHSKAPVPTDLTPHLLQKFPKAKYNDALRSLIQEAASVGNNATTVAAPPAESLVAIAANVVLAAAGDAATPPSMLAQTNAALAAIYTAGSTAGWSNMSSLGNSQRSLFREFPEREEDPPDEEADTPADDNLLPPPVEDNLPTPAEPPDQTGRRSTRSTLRLRSPDSDDELTIGEDNFEVNDEENFWDPGHPLLDGDDADSFNSHQDDDDDTVGDVAAAPLDIASLLRDATNFGFTEVLPDAVQNMPPPETIYNAPSGLKEGVANLIQTPFDAFRHSGFTEEMLSRWTKNSNK
jgi:hypothetical protein